MKRSTDDKPVDLPANEKRVCWSCTALLRKEEVDYLSGLCGPCIHGFMIDLDVEKSQAGNAAIAYKHADWYGRELKNFGELSRRDRTRMLMLAAGGEVRNETERERAAVPRLRGKFITLSPVGG